MKKKLSAKWSVAFYVIYSLLGIYLLTAGLLNTFNFLNVVRSAIFWGIFFIIVGSYHIMRIMHKK